ncbi:MAG: hypothetical protein QOJ94_1529 [Sphingomonadales bacterium]|jgi:uncharacterized membrane protein|nr:hypothetical protein [Sphingomonadales bacterium]
MIPISLSHLPAGNWLHGLILAALAVHIGAACAAILAGYGAMAVRKGGPLHRRFGLFFVGAMLAMAVTASFLALRIHERGNIAAGILAFYLVLSGWITVRREPGRIGRAERAAAFIPLGVAALMVLSGLQAAASPVGLDNYPAGPYFALAIVAGLLLAGDVAMIRRGGLSGNRRLARHAGRMGFAFFMAASFFFIGRQKLMPDWLRGAAILYLLGLAPLAMTLYWLVRLRFRTPRPAPAG